jgi:hypothetical protein
LYATNHIHKQTLAAILTALPVHSLTTYNTPRTKDHNHTCRNSAHLLVQQRPVARRVCWRQDALEAQRAGDGVVRHHLAVALLGMMGIKQTNKEDANSSRGK